MIIKNACLYDGTGNLPFVSDSLIQDGKIKKIKKNIVPEDDQIFKAEGLSLAPGFINMHSHSDLEIFRNSKMEHSIRQGITTEVVGQDGSSVAPVNENILKELADNMSPLAGVLDKDYWWSSFEDYLNAVEEARPSIKLVSLVGHGTIRMCIMGNDKRKPSKNELKRMKDLAETCLKEGAKGMSFGLVYPPGSYAETDELIEMAEVITGFDGLIMVHMRNEGDELLNSIDEMEQIIRKTKVRMNISHLKSQGPKNWGRLYKALQKISELRAEGMDIGFDHYPYTAGCTGLKRVVPEWVYNEGEKGFQKRLKNITEYKRIMLNTKNRIENIFGGPDRVVIVSVPFTENEWMAGRSLAYIAQKMNIPPEEAALQILKKSPSVTANYFSMNEKDIIEAMKSPLQTICTDGILGVHPHPRTYASFPRVLGHYCRENNHLSLEEAIRKMTSEPARRLRLWDRGVLREGMVADMVLFDSDQIADSNSYDDPKVFPKGIKAVWVNGTLAYPS